MSDSSSTLAQMLFRGKPALNFAHVVSELQATLDRYPATRRSLGWDCDDLAIFDLDGARIVLGYTDDLDGPHAACLTVAVGEGPQGNGASPIATRRAAFCRKITDRLAARHEPDSTLWHDVDQPLTADLIDALVDQVPEHRPARARRGRDGRGSPSGPHVGRTERARHPAADELRPPRSGGRSGPVAHRDRTRAGRQ